MGGDTRPSTPASSVTLDRDDDNSKESFPDSGRNKKRKWERGGRLQHGSRGGDKKKNMGRREHFREQLDRRGRNDSEKAKRQKLEEDGKTADSVLPSAFPKEEIEAEERRPKRKVAVMLGYSGTGYKGMQIDTLQKTIEGDLFTAFVAAGAISKSNADDPKKSSLVRCARTDKGVHAAGNVISLKLIIEDADIVEKINSHLSPQIRVWGIERTTAAFSCYQACDSRWYEYLIPTHAFLPPHPSSFMGKKIVEIAEKQGDLKEHLKRQEEVADFWAEVEEKTIKPLLDAMDDSIRPLVEASLYQVDGYIDKTSDSVVDKALDIKVEESSQEEAKAQHSEPITNGGTKIKAEAIENAETDAAIQQIEDSNKDISLNDTSDGTVPLPENTLHRSALDAAIKSLRRAYMDAKRSYRISSARKIRVQETLNQYLGTKNYHNYTVRKKFKDPSAKRHIKSFQVAEQPIMINDTEWLSLKVHGQSFMMHQIRKMVGMAALVVRCGCPIERMEESYKNVLMPIPKAPGLGLLLERPVFDSYNTLQAEKHGRATVDFDRYKETVDEFKQREIYERIFREEAESNQFHNFFSHIDNYRDSTFLYVTSGGFEATLDKDKEFVKDKAKLEEIDSEDDGEGGDS
ncbi:pseudouridine synthase [Lophium mytilinum]|uniref:tRNA pseudouridine synthase 1 n=1 Tax=Lophium mytilinum TaxID=390894 RepID=A0A6A6QYW4_9PEZI|nr:pseudouridine synthase [Lophium mytilinum]